MRYYAKHSKLKNESPNFGKLVSNTAQIFKFLYISLTFHFKPFPNSKI